MSEREYCCACERMVRVEYNVNGDDMPTCAACGSDELEPREPETDPG
jgi:hypothetical protein